MKLNKWWLVCILSFNYYIDGKAQTGVSLANEAVAALNINISNISKVDKLEEAKTKIDKAFQYEDVQAIARIWIIKGEVYLRILDSEKEISEVYGKTKVHYKGDNIALVAYKALQTSLSLVITSEEKADAYKDLLRCQTFLRDIGVQKINDNEYPKAFLSLETALKSHEFLSSKNQKSLFDDKVIYKYQLYLTGYAAYLGKQSSEALKYFNLLYKQGPDQAVVYKVLYELNKANGDLVLANKMLKEGRIKFPQSTELSYIEINNLLAEGNNNSAQILLDKAILLEPENATLYYTLGKIYEGSYNSFNKEGNETKALECFQKSMYNYLTANAKDSNNLKTLYAIGVLCYNVAANISTKIKTETDIKKMKAMIEEKNSLLDMSLPYFQKAEIINPNDLETLTVLSRIYKVKCVNAATDVDINCDIEKAILARLNNVKENGTNGKSYFKK